MSLTGIKTLPLLAGTVASASPWQALFARSGFRVYPFQLGAKVRTTSTGTAVQLYGLGQIVANDYIVFCDATAYGAANMYVPNLNKIRRATVVSTSDDAITIDAAVSITAGDYMLVIGADTATAPESAPNYDGSTISLYSDNVGVTSVTPKYLQTTTGGAFIGWVGSDTRAVDLLVTNSSGIPQIIQPFVATLPTQEVNQIRTFTAAGATPSVAGFRTVKIAQSGATPITNLTGGVAGQLVMLLFTDGNSTIADSAPFKLNGAYAPSADDTLTLEFDGTSWYEIARSKTSSGSGSQATQAEILIESGSLAGVASKAITVPSTYDELRLEILGRINAAATDSGVLIWFNNDKTGANYRSVLQEVEATTVLRAADLIRVLNMPDTGSTAGWVGQAHIYIPDYAGTTFHKVVHSQGWGTGATDQATRMQNLCDGSWENTVAITRIDIDTAEGGNFATGATYRLYGMKSVAVVIP